MDEQIVSLVGKFLDGDEGAFEQVAESLGKQAYRLAVRSVGDPSLADDIAQEALLRVYTQGRELADVRSFPAWFYRVVLNLVHDHYRKASREQKALLGLEEIGKVREKGKTQPLRKEERDRLRRTLQAALAALDEKHRETFLLKEVEGKSHAEIAKLLGIPEGTVWSRLSYARRRLQGTLKRAGQVG